MADGVTRGSRPWNRSPATLADWRVERPARMPAGRNHAAGSSGLRWAGQGGRSSRRGQRARRKHPFQLPQPCLRDRACRRRTLVGAWRNLGRRLLRRRWFDFLRSDAPPRRRPTRLPTLAVKMFRRATLRIDGFVSRPQPTSQAARREVEKQGRRSRNQMSRMWFRPAADHARHGSHGRRSDVFERPGLVFPVDGARRRRELRASLASCRALPAKSPR